MELKIKQENLSKAFNIMGKVASSRTSLPILSNVLLKTDGSRLLVAATNLEIAVSQKIPSKIEKAGSITVPAKLVGEFISNLPKGDVSLKVDNNHLLIESGNYKSKINGTPDDEFPELPTVKADESVKISIPVDDFKNAVSQTIITASNDAARPVLTGVYWHSFEGDLYLAATDGYRLSEKKLMPTDDEISVIIATTSLREVSNSIHDGVEEIEMFIDENQVEFHVGDIVIVSKTIDGNFVDYRRLIPTSTETEVKISKADFVRIVKVSSLFARDSGGSVTLEANAENEKLSIHSIASEYGENTSEADAEINGGGEVTLNSRYLIEALNVVNAEKITFGFSGKIAPTIIKDSKESDYIHIIMPLKS